MRTFIRLGGLLAVLAVLAFAGKHLFPARTVGDVTVPSPLATPTEAKATIDQARRDIDAAAKAAADRASVAE